MNCQRPALLADNTLIIWENIFSYQNGVWNIFKGRRKDRSYCKQDKTNQCFFNIQNMQLN